MKKIMYVNANVITVNEKEEVLEAVLVSDGKIEAVGTTDEILKLIEVEDEDFGVK